MERSDQVQFVLAGGEERVDDLHGNFDFDLRLLGTILLEHMHEQIAVLLGAADVGVLVLDGDKLTVFGGAHGVNKSPQINAMAVDIVEPDLAAVQPVLIDGGENLFGKLQGNVYANGFLVLAGVADADVQPAITAGGGDTFAVPSGAHGSGGRGLRGTMSRHRECCGDG